MPLRSMTPSNCSPPGGSLARAVSSMQVHNRLLSSIGNSPAARRARSSSSSSSKSQVNASSAHHMCKVGAHQSTSDAAQQPPE
jgi:hypothetical protein